MRFLLQGFGSRGDVQPMIELGRGLRRAGHDDVVVMAWTDFGPMVEEAGLGFSPYPMTAQQLQDEGLVTAWTQESRDPLKANRLQTAFLESVAPVVADAMMREVREGDVTINGLLAADPMATLGPIRGATTISALFCPLLTTRSATSFMQPVMSRDSRINRAWSAVAMGIYAGVGRAVSDRVRAELHLPPRTRRDYVRSLYDRSLLAVSPTVVPPAPDWPDTHVQTGWWFMDDAATFEPPAGLEKFLAAGERPVYISYGSLGAIAPHPDRDAWQAVEACLRAGVRGIVDRGLLGHDFGELPDGMYAVEQAPHDWLFPRMAAVVHHGGSGTTGAAFRAGVPQLVVPHVGDQEYFGRRVQALGCGPAPVKRHEVTGQRLAEAITAMTSDPAMADRAARIGRRVRAEDGVGDAVRQIEEWIG